MHYLQQWPYCHDRQDAVSTAVAILWRSPWCTLYSSGHIVTIDRTQYLQQWPYCDDRHDSLSTAVAILSRSTGRSIYSSCHIVTIAMTQYLQQWPYCHHRHDAVSTTVAILSRSPWRSIDSRGHIVTIATKQSPSPCVTLRLAPLFLSDIITQLIVSNNVIWMTHILFVRCERTSLGGTWAHFSAHATTLFLSAVIDSSHSPSILNSRYVFHCTSLAFLRTALYKVHTSCTEQLWNPTCSTLFIRSCCPFLPWTRCSQ
jgi:hypothetical protein